MSSEVALVLIVLSFLVGFIFNEILRGRKDDGKMEFSERLDNGK